MPTTDLRGGQRPHALIRCMGPGGPGGCGHAPGTCTASRLEGLVDVLGVRPGPVVHELGDGRHFQHPPGVPCQHCRAEEEQAGGGESGEPPAAVDTSAPGPADPLRGALVAERARIAAAHERAGADMERAQAAEADARRRRSQTRTRLEALDGLLAVWDDTTGVEG